MFESKNQICVTLLCQNPACGKRRCEVSLPLYERTHRIDCDRCGETMKITSASSTLSPESFPPVWFDVHSSMRDSLASV